MITQNICKSFLLDLVTGNAPNFGTDVVKLALYTATLDADTIATYTAVNETGGGQYTAGGYTLVAAAGFPKLSTSGSRKVLMSWTDIARPKGAHFTSRAALIYNSTNANRAIATLDFGRDYVCFSAFGLMFPTTDDDHCIVRIGA